MELNEQRLKEIEEHLVLLDNKLADRDNGGNKLDRIAYFLGGLFLITFYLFVAAGAIFGLKAYLIIARLAS